MKKIFSTLLAALLVAGMTTAAFADETAAPEAAPASDEFNYYGELVDTGVQNVAPFGLENVAIGTVMGAGETTEGNEYDKAFDGNIDTFWQATANNWSTHFITIKMAEAVTPAGFALSTQTAGDGIPTRFHAIFHSNIQGSNDGVTWETLYYVEDDYIWYSEDYAETGVPYIICPVEGAGAYTYFRYGNNDDGANALSEFAVLTALPEVAEEEEKASDEFNFYGELVDTGVKNVAPYSLENVAVGTVMGAGETTEGNEYDKAFDGNIDTFWQATANNWATHFITIKMDEAVVPAGFVLSTQTAGDGVPTRFHAIFHSNIQGSNDGVTWETLYYVEDDYIWYSEDYAEFGTPYIICPVETETAYTYFRYGNNDDGANALSEFAVLTALPEAADVEAPAEEPVEETEAPAEETEAPAEEEPATDAPAEEAPATFDAGVIAAAAAVVAAAGYAIARKRK